MNNRGARIDLAKLVMYMLKRCWLMILCAAIGFGGVYWYTMRQKVDTYTASGTMYVLNGNPNLLNYGYTNTTDLNSAVQLLDTYMVVIKSNKVMDVLVERLAPNYPGITAAFITKTLSMGSVSETGVMRVSSRTNNPQMSADICNAVLDVAPSEIIRVVGAGSIEIIDYATAPSVPDSYSPMRRAMLGGLAGAVLASALLFLMFLLNRKITYAKDLTDNYTLPILASVQRQKGESPDPGAFILNEKSSMEDLESYAKLRMNLLYTLVGKKSKSVAVVSAISGEGKSTVSANLAISVAMSGKKVLLIDADLRRACQHELFYYDRHLNGLSEVLAGMCSWQDTLINTSFENLQILPAGRQPPNPSELLESETMKKLLKKIEQSYDLILLDVPPINIVSDPLALSEQVAGSIFVVRQNYSDLREIRKALIASEMTGMELLGFVFYGEKLKHSEYYNRKYYKSYYHKYDTRGQTENGGSTT